MKFFKNSGLKQYLAVIAVFGLIGGAIYVYASHAEAATVVIAPTDWLTVKRSSIVTDSSKGSVMKLNPFISDSKKDTGGIVVSIGPATRTYINGKPLAKLHNFITEHFGQPATICMTARASKANSMFALVGWGLDPNHLGFDKYPRFGTSYEKKCYDFTIISKANFEKYHPKDAPEWLEVQVESGFTGYLDNVTISLR